MNEEEAKKTLKTMKENIDKKYLKSRNSVAIETVLNLIKTQQAEIEKKDKMIDLMAEWLYEDDTSFGYGNLKEVNTPEKIKQYFERKVENGN